MRAPAHVLMATVFALIATAPPLAAQVRETPIPFDSAGKITTLTPRSVARYGLAPPAWPVQGDFAEARLFAVSTGGRVIIVERAGRAMDRYALSTDEAEALQREIDAAVARVGAAPTEERPTVVAESVRGRFIWSQMALTWGLYAPLATALTDDGRAASAIFLASTGLSYFITSGITRTAPVTRAQWHLSTDGALRGVATSTGALYLLAGNEPSGETYAFTGLAGALIGTTWGYQYGKRVTDAEAQAATSISNYAAATALGVGASLGAFEAADGRVFVGSMVTAGALGYGLGPRYARRSGYTVTRGDVQMLWPGALLGISTAITPLIDSEDVDERTAFGVATMGMLAGIVLADRVWVAPYDHSPSDVTQVSLGLLSGGLLGGAVGIMADAPAMASWALVTGGAILGTIGGHALARPARAGARQADTRRSRPAVELEVNALEGALGLARVPGRHALVTLRF